MKPRHYQTTAVDSVFDHWNNGVRSVLVVAPTGAGKTVMIVMAIRRLRATKRRALVVVHRRELVTQASEKLREVFGSLDVGVIAPGHDYSPFAPIQVGTVQTLLAKKALPDVEVVVFDEAHHFLADDWGKLGEHYSKARCLGVTATPERSDGRALGDMFDQLVVTTSYSELIAEGFLVSCRVFRPPETLGSDLAQHPLQAYQNYGEGSGGFIFASSVATANELAGDFRAAGVSAEAITAKTPPVDRAAIMRRLKSGETLIGSNVYTLTEGVDVPAARVCILARGCNHVSPFLQMVGRVLRPAPGKADAILLDLSGATLKHGLPTEARIYSLKGKGITRTAQDPLRNCPMCGATMLASVRACIACGFVPPVAARKMPKIHDVALQAVWDGANTPQPAKDRELDRLRLHASGGGYSVGWVVKEYRRLFDEPPQMTPDEQRSELRKLQALGAAKGYKRGFASSRFKEMFGGWPPGAWL